MINYNRRRSLSICAYIFGIIAAAFGLGYICGGEDCETDRQQRQAERLKRYSGRYDWEPDEDSDEAEEKPAIECAEGGEEEFYKTLEEADKEEEKNESEE